MTKPDDQRARGRAIEPPFQVLLQAGWTKQNICPKHFEKAGRHNTAIYVISLEGVAHSFAALTFGNENSTTVIAEIDISSWAQTHHAEVAEQFVQAAGFSVTSMETR